MPDAEFHTNRLLQALTQVPTVRPGVCTVCHSGPNAGFDVRWSCQRTMSEVSVPTDLVLPISLYELGSQLHMMLRDYKDAPWPELRRDHVRSLAATLARFYAGHSACVAARLGGPPDLVTTVPSTRDRVGAHPLVAVVRMVNDLAWRYRALLAPGSVRVERAASDDAFQVTGEVAGTRVLVVDDTFTTGARAQSAASALGREGADVAVLVLGRVVGPDYNDACRALWRTARARLFRFDRCGWFDHGVRT